MLVGDAADSAGKQEHREHDEEVDVGDESDDEPDDAPLRFRFSWRKLWRFAGPGWLMSLAYLDPGNLEGDLQQGAYTQMQLVWVLWWATVMGLILQEMSARLGLVTGYDLAQMVRAQYPRWLNYVVYVNMELAVIGADIQEVVGAGIGIHLLSGGRLPVWVGCLITAVDTLTFFAIQYLGVRYLEGFICLLVFTMSICFFVNWGASGTDAGQLLHGWLVPSLPSYAITQAVGTIGAVIMPHNLYLHSGLVMWHGCACACALYLHSGLVMWHGCACALYLHSGLVMWHGCAYARARAQRVRAHTGCVDISMHRCSRGA